MAGVTLTQLPWNQPSQQSHPTQNRPSSVVERPQTQREASEAAGVAVGVAVVVVVEAGGGGGAAAAGTAFVQATGSGLALLAGGSEPAGGRRARLRVMPAL